MHPSVFHFVPVLCLRPAPESQPQCDLHSGLAAEGRFEGRERGKIYCTTVSIPPPSAPSGVEQMPRQRRLKLSASAPERT